MHLHTTCRSRAEAFKRTELRQSFSSVRRQDLRDLDHDEYDSLNPVPLNASARSTRVCRCTPLSRCQMNSQIDLGERRIFFILCNIPQQWYQSQVYVQFSIARVEHKSVVGVDLVNFLAATSLFLLQRYCGMKWPGPTLQVRLRETGSTD